MAGGIDLELQPDSPEMQSPPGADVLPLSLAALFAAVPIAEDRDGDGLIDRVNLQIAVAPGIRDALLWAAILNLTARLAFVSVAADLPLLTTIAKASADRPVLRIHAPRRRVGTAWAEIRRTDRHPLQLDVRAADSTCLARLLDGLDTRPDHRAECPAGWQAVRLQAAARPVIQYTDAGGRPLGTRIPEGMVRQDVAPGTNGSIAATIPDAFDLLDAAAAGNWFVTDAVDPRAVWLGLRLHLAAPSLATSTGLSLGRAVVRLVARVTCMPCYPVMTEPPPAHVPLLRISERPARAGRPGDSGIIRLHNDRTAAPLVEIQGTARSLGRALQAWLSVALCDSGARFAQVQAFRQKAAEFRQILGGEGFWGRWATAIASGGETVAHQYPAPAPPAVRRLAAACRALHMPVPDMRAERMLRRKYAWSSESDRVLEQVRGIPAGSGPVRGWVMLSKPQPDRDKLKGQIADILSAKGYAPDVSVGNAYKAGLSWLLEQILPRLETAGGVQRIELRYRPFATSADQLELRSRWLQEIFPGPDLLAGALGVQQEHMVLMEAPEEQTEIYRLRAWRTGSDLLLDEAFSPFWQAMPYRLNDPAQGSIHPCTAGLRLESGPAILLDVSLPTDRQVFWTHFQSQWLPLLEARMRERLADGLLPEDPAFWESIRIRVAIDETDLRLGLDRERICPMEALHEDLYFFLLNAFQQFAAANGLPDTIGLGAVLPVVEACTADGIPRAWLEATPLAWQRAPRTEPRVKPPVLTILRKGVRGRGWELSFTGIDDPLRPKLTVVAQAWGYRCRSGTGKVTVKLPEPGAANLPAPAGPGLQIPATRYLSMAETRQVLDGLGSHPGLSVWTAGRSMRGLPIQVIEAVSVPRADVLSAARLRLLKPVLLINARHHANEISSTPAVLRFMADLAEGRLGDGLRRASVVCIPMENMDGVAAFEAIAGQGRDHKLHAARYNAVGAEFYADYFRSPPRFSEAAVKTLLWRRWLPELMLDLHGVPGHEWEQPFAGYAPARFEQYWIPSTFVYAIVPCLDEPSHALHADAVRLIAAMRQAIGGQEAIVQRNRRLAERYRRYARRPESDIFPEMDDDVLAALPPLGRTRDVNFARRYPGVTRSEIIVEVTDEGSDGQDLYWCETAHYTISEAMRGALNALRGTLGYFSCGPGEAPALGWQVEWIV